MSGDDRFHAIIDGRCYTFVAAPDADPDDPLTCRLQNLRTGEVTWWRQVTA